MAGFLMAEGLLVDPAARRITPVWLEYHWRKIAQRIGCETISCLNIPPHDDALFYDDEFLIKPWGDDTHKPCFEVFNAYGQVRATICGHALLLGHDGVERTEQKPRLGLERFSKRIGWRDPMHTSERDRLLDSAFTIETF